MPSMPAMPAHAGPCLAPPCARARRGGTPRAWYLVPLRGAREPGDSPAPTCIALMYNERRTRLTPKVPCSGTTTEHLFSLVFTSVTGKRSAEQGTGGTPARPPVTHGVTYHVTAAQVRRFAARWPCYGRIGPLTFTLDKNGDLVDLRGDTGMDEQGVGAIVDMYKEGTWTL